MSREHTIAPEAINMDGFLTAIVLIFTAWINMQIISKREQTWNDNLNEGNKYIAFSLVKTPAFFYFKKPFKYMPQLSVGNKFQY